MKWRGSARRSRGRWKSKGKARTDPCKIREKNERRTAVIFHICIVFFSRYNVKGGREWREREEERSVVAISRKRNTPPSLSLSQLRPTSFPLFLRPLFFLSLFILASCVFSRQAMWGREALCGGKKKVGEGAKRPAPPFFFNRHYCSSAVPRKRDISLRPQRQQPP